MEDHTHTSGQHRAAQALAVGSTNIEAAALGGVSVSTLKRWKQQGDFRALVRRYTPQPGPTTAARARQIVEDVAQHSQHDLARLIAALCIWSVEADAR